MKTKETVLELVSGDKDGMSSFSLALEDMEPKERPSFFEGLFLRAIRKFKDEPAYKFFIWLMQSISDIESSEEKSFNQRTEKAKELYLKLPPHEMHGIRIQIARDESKPGKEEFPTLMKTRETILTEMFSQCFRTKNEEEARTLLYLLLDLPIKFKEEKELIRKVIQDTDSIANPGRLERCFEWTMSKPYDVRIGPFSMRSDGMEEIAHILAKGWIRNIEHVGWDRNGFKELLHRMKIFRPLINSSDGAVEFLERISEEVAGIDRKVRCLVNRIKQDAPNKFPQERILGDIDLIYPRDMSVPFMPIITITPNRISEEQKSKLFELAVTRIEEWRKDGEENAGIRIRLIIASKDPKFARAATV